MPDISCSFTYFPSGNFPAVHASSKPMGFTAKGGGGWLFNSMRQRAFIPVAAMDADINGNFIYAAIADQIAGMPSFIVAFFQAALNASVNYSTDNIAGADQLIIPVENFGSYLYQRVANNSLMLDRYKYIANQIFNFWTNANPAWTANEMTAAINNFKTQLIQYLADPNLYVSPNGYDFGAASVATVAIDAFKVTDPDLVAFDTIEIYVP